MRLLGLFGKKEKDQLSPRKEEANDTEELEVYAGLRVEVTTFDGRLLFVAKLLGLHGNQGELHQYSEAELPEIVEVSEDSEEVKPLHVRIRGYSDHERKAVYMEGFITPRPKHVWHVDELTIARLGNERAFFRLDTNTDATATMFSGLEMGEKPCKLLNISVGGARIASECKYHEGDKFLLKVKLLEDRPESIMFCQVLRIIEKNESKFEYGCRFLELTEEDQEKITQNIFAVQRKTRGSS